MISVEKALELVLANLPKPKAERVPFENALGHVLAQDLSASGDIPPFDRSAMDGYAVRAEDVQSVPVELEIAGEIRAGEEASWKLGAGQAAAIMTGAPVPDGADAVQMVEQTRRSAGNRKVTLLKTVCPGENIRKRASEAARGECILGSGKFVGPAELAILATFGCSEVQVWKRPSVALGTTGDELVEVNEEPGPGQIRNSNAYSLGGQLRLMGFKPDYMGIARDDKAELRRMITRGLLNDVLILTGGVSMGEYDFVKEVFEELGLEVIFSKVAMKPGKPTVFARRGDTLVFGLPGNPVSTFIAFENLVRPALARLCGMQRTELPKIKGRLLAGMRQLPGRKAFLPARVRLGRNSWEIEPLQWTGSSDIIGFSRANAAVIFPAEDDLLAAGTLVEAMLFPDFFQRLTDEDENIPV